jgi:hypothetical protein
VHAFFIHIIMMRSCQLLLIAGLLVQLGAGQASGWLYSNQNSTSMCYWVTPRAAIVRDTVYIDGGDLYWDPTLSDGTLAPPSSDGNPSGTVYALNFSSSFSVTQNISQVFFNISKAPNDGAANNVGPNYSDGAMFANDYEWMIYGGMVQKTSAYSAQASNAVAAYEVYSQDAAKSTVGGFILDTLPDGTSRYVTDGAAVSVPSENLGFYFAGLRAASFGPIYEISGNASENADTLSTTLIQANMTEQQHETWANFTLPDTVPGRASAEIVWVPVSEQGILVAIGGVINPAYMYVAESDNATQLAQSQSQSPGFLDTVSIYDIASQTWYEQKTTNPPSGQFAQGCTVVASAPDYSSHNIYWYGGFDGLHLSQNFYDDVWVLSLPSFTWTNVYNGSATAAAHGRAGHKCVKPYPDQMFVIGGYTASTSSEPTCLGGGGSYGGIIQIFNLSSNAWIDTYSPTRWSNYTVPSAVYNVIGGTSTGGATLATPSPSGFSNATLASFFESKNLYNVTKITNWYPYTPATTPTPSATTLPTPIPKSSGTPKYLAPVLGVVLGLIAISLIILAIILWRRRHYLRSSRAASEAGTMDNRRWVTSWLRSTPADDKPPPTVTTDDTPMTPYEEAEIPLPVVPEMGEGQVHEMMDTSRPSELGFNTISPKNGRPGVTHSASTTSNRSRGSGISGVSLKKFLYPWCPRWERDRCTR